MPRKEAITKMPKRTTIMRNLICPHCKVTNRIEVLSGATVYLFCIDCGKKMKWFEKDDGKTSGKIISLPPPKDESERSEDDFCKQLKAVSKGPEKPKEPEIKWA